MKSALVAAAIALAVVGFSANGAQAAGCLKGAAVGGATGHFVGHHGLLGAGIGCLVGRHQANKRARIESRRDSYGYGSSGSGYGSSSYSYR